MKCFKSSNLKGIVFITWGLDTNNCHKYLYVNSVEMDIVLRKNVLMATYTCLLCLILFVAICMMEQIGLHMGLSTE